jgi:thiol-disulfide isomerase/thioredoxin
VRSIKTVVLALFAGLNLIACQSRAKEPTAAPDFELKDLSGKKVSLSSLRGKPVMLDFWATWCGPCQMSIPTVQKFYETHKDKGLVVLGVNVDEDPSNVYAFVKHFNMTYPVLYGGGTPISDAYGVEGIPMFVFIDPQGRITRRFNGFDPSLTRDWEEELNRATASKT